MIKDNFEFYLKKQVNSIVYNLAHHLYRNIYPFESIPTRPEIAHMAGSVKFDIKVESVRTSLCAKQLILFSGSKLSKYLIPLVFL